MDDIFWKLEPNGDFAKIIILRIERVRCGNIIAKVTHPQFSSHLNFVNAMHAIECTVLTHQLALHQVVLLEASLDDEY